MAYLSDGPTRTYRIEGRELTFEHTVLKEAGFRYKESSLLVQALKTLGPKRITPETIRRLRTVIARDLRPKVLKDTRTAPIWIRNAILKVCEESA
ncbi:MAG: DUF6088 family protein [bacterium]